MVEDKPDITNYYTIKLKIMKKVFFIITVFALSFAIISSPGCKKKKDEDDDDGNEIFCICRRPDNHTWMIGCDGGCEDWFHGKCVNIDPRDAELIDKYICQFPFDPLSSHIII